MTACNGCGNNNKEKTVKILNGIAVAGLTIVALTLGSTDSLGQGACDHGGNHTIQVSEGEGEMPVLSYRGGSAEEVHVCVGDQVQWVLTGSNREFLVDFFSGAPFDGASTRGSSGNAVSVVIGAAAERRGYDYGVQFAGGPDMDPRIVVD
jgi:hypothetical protein